MKRTIKDTHGTITIITNNYGEIEVTINSPSILSKKVFQNIYDFKQYWKERKGIVNIVTKMMSKQEANNPNWNPMYHTHNLTVKE